MNQLGLGQYGPVLAAQDIDLDVLPDLTAEDLAAAGVGSVGHRRRILTAAVTLRQTARPVPVPVPVQGPFTPAPATPALLTPALLTTASSTLSEQRIITAMFCDLVGSTRWSTLLDPEEYRDLITRFRALVEHTLSPFDGHVSRFLGDGIVVFFGLSKSEEHTAENAVAAALEIVVRMQGIEAAVGQPAQVRLGIATGVTLVEAQGRALEDAVVGEVPNLAARLQSEAEPGGILISQATRDRLGQLFRCEDAGLMMLKGYPAGLRAWRVLGHNDAASRFDALRSQTTGSDFVGRADELARLAQQAAKAKQGEGCVSLIVGEAGMGKSRLAREALVAAGLDPEQVPVLQCTPYHVGTPFHPLRRLIARSVQGQHGLPDPHALAAFLAALGIDGARNLVLVQDLLSDKVAALLGTREVTEQRAELLDLLTGLLAAMARKAGAILIEDVQWLDPSSGELLGRVMAQRHGLGSHLIVTRRPGPVPLWFAASGARTLLLDRLRDSDFADLIRAIARTSALPVDVSDAQVAEIAARCDGSPVFAEELTRYMLEAGTEAPQGADRPLPATLADSLLARLDRLEGGRLLAQLGAVIGNEFPVAVLVAVSGLSETDAGRGIQGLIAAGVLRDGHSGFGPAVAFRHMLLQEAAYMTLLRSDRQVLHARIAAVLTGDFPQVADAVPQVVAYQLSRGGRLQEAATYWDRAGTRAARRSAYVEAIGHFRRALEDLSRAVPQAELGSVRIEQTELTVRLNLVAALIASEGFNAAAVREEMPLVEALGAALQSREQLLPLLVTKWVLLGANGHPAAALDVARQISNLAASGSEIHRLLALRTMGTSHLFRGDFDDAIPLLTAFLDLYDPVRHDPGLNVFGTSNHATMVALGLAEIAFLREQSEASTHWFAKAESMARATGQAHDLCNVSLFLGCILPALKGDFTTVSAKASQLLAVARHHALPNWEGFANVFLGTAMIVDGQVLPGIDLAQRGMDQSLHRAAFLNFVLMFHSEACLHAGQIDEARNSFARIGRQHLDEENWLYPEVQRIAALVAAACGEDPVLTRHRLRQAKVVAARQGANLFLRKIAASAEQYGV